MTLRRVTLTRGASGISDDSDSRLRTMTGKDGGTSEQERTVEPRNEGITGTIPMLRRINSETLEFGPDSAWPPDNPETEAIIRMMRMMRVSTGTVSQAREAAGEADVEDPMMETEMAMEGPVAEGAQAIGALPEMVTDRQTEMVAQEEMGFPEVHHGSTQTIRTGL